MTAPESPHCEFCANPADCEEYPTMCKTCSDAIARPVVSNEQREAAHALASSEDLCDWWGGGEEDHSTPCERIAQAISAAELRGAEKRLDMNDEELVAEIAFDIGQATKMQPSMDGRCKRLHDDAENRRIARAAIRAINRLVAIRARRP